LTSEFSSATPDEYYSAKLKAGLLEPAEPTRSGRRGPSPTELGILNRGGRLAKVHVITEADETHIPR
jgi:hypothetical protein